MLGKNNKAETDIPFNVEQALDDIRILLEEQYKRNEEMEKQGEKMDYSLLNPLIIGLVDGDGIGPVIMTEAKRVLEKLLDREINSGKIILKQINGLTVENRIAFREAVPSDVLSEIKKCHVLLKGPTTTPKGGNLESANVTLRRELDLFANVRPVTVEEEGIDWIFFRENTEGEYVLGSRGICLDDKLTMDFKVTTKSGTERIAQAAFDYAVKNRKTSVSVVTKANIMKKTDGMFSQICHRVGENYPNIKIEDWYVDIMAANLINPQIRREFQVFLLPNLYGDIITDEAAQIQGGVGTAGSANIGNKYAMFEAIHGSAPRMVEDGLASYANPSSIFKAIEMMLIHIGYQRQASNLGETLNYCLKKDKKVEVTGLPDGATCTEFTDYLLENLK